MTQLLRMLLGTYTVLARGTRHDGCDTHSSSFDYYLLVQQYTPSFPLVDIHDELFTLHGLWPSRNTTRTLSSYPCFCEPLDRFTPDALPLDLHRELVSFWPTLMPGHSNEWFWIHEWQKHGSCADTLRISDAYWRMALRLRSEYDLGAVFHTSPLAPLSADVVHTIRQRIYDKWGVTPLVACSGGAMLSITLCVDRTTHDVVPCSTAVLEDHGYVNKCWV